MKIVTTVTTYFDVDTQEQEVSVNISDEDGLSEASSQILGAVLIGSMRSVERGLRSEFHIPETVGKPEPTCDTNDPHLTTLDLGADAEYVVGHVHSHDGRHIKP